MLNRSLYSLLQLPINHRLGFATNGHYLLLGQCATQDDKMNKKLFSFCFVSFVFFLIFVCCQSVFNCANKHIPHRNYIKSYALISYSELSSSSTWWHFQGSHSNSVFFPKSFQIKCIIHINNATKLCISALPFLNCFWLCKAFLCNSFYGNVYSSNWI